MRSVRRWCIFLVATISLQAVAWAVIIFVAYDLGASSVNIAGALNAAGVPLAGKP